MLMGNVLQIQVVVDQIDRKQWQKAGATVLKSSNNLMAIMQTDCTKQYYRVFFNECPYQDKVIIVIDPCDEDGMLVRGTGTPRPDIPPEDVAELLDALRITTPF